jgi:hypothetical protein
MRKRVRRHFHKANVKIVLSFLSSNILGGNVLNILTAEQVELLCTDASLTEGVGK